MLPEATQQLQAAVNIKKENSNTYDYTLLKNIRNIPLSLNIKYVITLL